MPCGEAVMCEVQSNSDSTIPSNGEAELKHPELNFVALFLQMALFWMIFWLTGLALLGSRSWNGTLQALLVLLVWTLVVHVQARLTEGFGIQELYKRWKKREYQNRNLTFIDASLIFIYIAGMDAYIIYLAILD
ncbi:hypothetical protein FYZ48_21270 [Gimesia chilikensis]|uniref:hypothetical protein n=1 Tax=Gimesia chilikensis TaxID=2605989 RepID=UPI0011F01C4C|nr:hypothetical protein [Gimesia chilikensis]KAA0134125.1 hypothetical protein FYZ48_21270 [Gimesia chilikensis]